MSFWVFVMCQLETSESLEGIFPDGLINHGKTLLKRFDSLYQVPGSSKFSGARQVVERLTGSVLTKELSMRYSLWYWDVLSD